MTFNVITTNKYLKVGLYHIFNSSPVRDLCCNEFIAYDRGDGMISFIPMSRLINIIQSSDPFCFFMEHRFVTFDARSDSLEKLRKQISKGIDEVVVITELCEREKSVLNLFLSVGSYGAAEEYCGVRYKTMCTIKYKMLKKLGVDNINNMIRIKNMWDKLMSPLCLKTYSNCREERPGNQRVK